ncbi:hypothetical protein SKAU_G00236560 [Synaphobranchus kaupii]|uniref:Uncharacterized protein n=1 Tax=Synaphobranchus kaupii TaxID=118154 RepID=A0A9Q1ISX1_SYNKA|nr:hypothetical protein SKAU_G00236560 [Synaphobranchus kaupii]
MCKRKTEGRGWAMEQFGCKWRNSPLGTKLRRFDGKGNWQVYLVQFNFIAEAAGWRENDVNLAASLEGDALQALLDINEGEPPTFTLLSAALARRCGEVTLQIALKEQLQAKERWSGEKLALYAADVQRLTQRAYPQLTSPVKDSLALNAFLRGLRPTHLRQQQQLPSGAWSSQYRRGGRAGSSASSDGFTSGALVLGVWEEGHLRRECNWWPQERPVEKRVGRLGSTDDSIYIRCPVTLKQEFFQADITDSCILGMDALATAGVTIDTAKRLALLKGQRLPQPLSSRHAQGLRKKRKGVQEPLHQTAAIACAATTAIEDLLPSQLQLAGAPMEGVAMDILGPFPVTEYVHQLQDRLHHAHQLASANVCNGLGSENKA